MATIKIRDLPKDMKIGKEELKRIRGGAISPMLVRHKKWDELSIKWGELKLPLPDLRYGKM